MRKYSVNDVLDWLMRLYQPYGPLCFPYIETARSHLLEHLVFHGEENQHLNVPKPEKKKGLFSTQEKRILLSGEEEVYGSFFLHYVDNSDKSENLYPLSSLREAKKSIMSERGILHPFCQSITILKDGKQHPYRLFLQDKKGTTLEFDKTSNGDLFYTLWKHGIHIDFEWKKVNKIISNI